MSHAHRLLIPAVALCVLLAGCATKRVIVPRTVPLPVRQYVAIPDPLTEPCPVAKGTLADVVDVAKARAKAIETCNAKLREIRAISDKAVQTNRTP